MSSGRGPSHIRWLHRERLKRIHRATLIAVALLVVAAFAAPSASAAIPTCDLYADPAAPAGGSGTFDNPISTFQRLADALTPGQTGCLASGAVFHDNVDLSGKSGTPDKPTRIISFDPLKPATLEGVPGSALP